MRYAARLLGWQLQKVPQRRSYQLGQWSFYRCGLLLWNWGRR